MRNALIQSTDSADPSPQGAEAAQGGSSAAPRATHFNDAVESFPMNSTTERRAAKASIEELFDEHSPRMFRAAYRVTGNMTDAEDVLQTVFVRLLKRDQVPDLGAGAGSYLHRAAVNAALDLLRKKKRAPQVAIDEEQDDDPGEGLIDAAAPLAFAERSEIRDLVRQAVGKLNERAAEIFALRYFEGYGNTEIAQMVGTSRSAIAVTLHRSREKLKVELGPILG